MNKTLCTVLTLLGLGLLAACGERRSQTADTGPTADQAAALLWRAHHPVGQAVQVRFLDRDQPATVILMDGHAYLGDDIIGDVRGQQVIGLTGQAIFTLGHTSITAQSSGITDAGLKWPGAVVPYVFDGSATSNIRSQFNQAVGVYNGQTVVRYVPRSNQANYVRVVAGDGCSSYVGMMSTSFKLNGQEITLGSDGCGLGGTLHEMGHAAGLEHEQQRQDRDTYITVNYSLIDPNWRSQYDIIRDNAVNTAFTAYDIHSIMHYGNSQVNGQWVMTSKQGAPPEQIGQNSGYLTDSDRQAFASIYGGSTGGGSGAAFQSTLLTPRANKCLDVPGGTAANGTQLQQWDCNGLPPQNFDFRAVAGRTDTYSIVNVGNGKCLDASGGGTGNGTQVIQWDCLNAPNQQWTLRAVNASANEYQLVGVASGRCIDVVGVAQNAGAKLNLWDCHSGANIATYGNQTWRINGRR